MVLSAAPSKALRSGIVLLEGGETQSPLMLGAKQPYVPDQPSHGILLVFALLA